MAVQISPLPKTPSRNDDPVTFQTDANAHVAALPQFRTQANALAVEAEGNALTAEAAAAAATTARNQAQASRDEAALMVNTPIWAAGTNYATNAFVRSPTDHELYQRLSPGGINSTDPAVDAANGIGSFWRKAPVLSTVAPPLVVPGNKIFQMNEVFRLHLHPSADTTARVWTIPANNTANLNERFGAGSVIPFINQPGAGIITIGITTDTLRLLGTGATGARQVMPGGGGALVKVTANEWWISGTGVV